jgi:hypothetical protein
MRPPRPGPSSSARPKAPQRSRSRENGADQHPDRRRSVRPRFRASEPGRQQSRKTNKPEAERKWIISTGADHARHQHDYGAAGQHACAYRAFRPQRPQDGCRSDAGNDHDTERQPRRCGDARSFAFRKQDVVGGNVGERNSNRRQPCEQTDTTRPPAHVLFRRAVAQVTLLLQRPDINGASVVEELSCRRVS